MQALVGPTRENLVSHPLAVQPWQPTVNNWAYTQKKTILVDKVNKIIAEICSIFTAAEV